MRPHLEAILSPGDGQTVVGAPRVGRFRSTTSSGQLLRSGDSIGELDVLNRRVELRLPQLSEVMRVVERPHDRGWAPVAWGAPLIILQPAALEASPEAIARHGSVVEGLSEAARPFTAPIDGQFYRRATPDSAPFVAEGDTLRPRQVVGLIEVMKFFYEVHFELAGFDMGARVVRVVAGDAQAVESGQVLLVVEPL